MNLDILSISHNYSSYNVKLANIVGLEVACYWQVLVDALHQAVKKNKVNSEGYFRIDRKYVCEKTTLSTKQQKLCDDILASAGLLRRSTDRNDLISMDLSAALQLLQEDDSKLETNLKETVARIRLAEKSADQSQFVSQSLKNKVKETDFDIRNALYDWIDSLNGKANTTTVEVFERNLNSYTADKNAKLKILEIAAVNGYRDFDWSKKIYEEKLRANSTLFPTQSTASRPTTNMNIATENDVDRTKKF